MRLTKDQQRALLRVYNRPINQPWPSYLACRRAVRFAFDGCAMIHWAGMWLGIERDGYTHS